MDKKSYLIPSLYFIIPFMMYLTIFFVIVWGGKYFALMDDAHFLVQARSYFDKGLFSYVIDYCWSDVNNWGMFRPILPIYIFILYNLFQDAPTLLYVFNYFYFIITIFIWAEVIYNFVRLNFTNLKRLQIYFFVFTLTIAFKDNNFIFRYASLQEKIALLFIALALLIIVKKLILKQLDTVKVLLGTIFLMHLAVLSRSTVIFILLTCIFLFTILSIYNPAHRKKLLIANIFLFLSFILYSILFLSIRKSYTQNYSLTPTHVFNLILKANMLFYLFALISVVGTVIVIFKYFTTRNYLWLIQLIWPFSCLLFQVLIIPWAFRYWYITPLCPFLIAEVILIIL